MCDHGETVTLWIRDDLYASVDRCIAPLVAALNATQFPTAASCCGHGHRPAAVILDDDTFVVLMTRAEYEMIRCHWPNDIHGNPIAAAKPGGSE